MLYFALLPLTLIALSNASAEDDRARQWLRTVNDESLRLGARYAQAKWNYETDISSDTSRALLDAAAVYDTYERSLTSDLKTFDHRIMEDPFVRRQIEQMQRYAVNESIWTEAASARER